MGLGEALLNVHLLLRKAFAFPILYNLEKEIWEPNPKLKKRWKMPLYNATLIIGIFVIVYSSLSLWSTWKAKDSDETSSLYLPPAYIFMMGVAIQFLVTVHTLKRDAITLAGLWNGFCGFADIKYRDWLNSERLPDLQELVGYGIAFTFCLFPLVISGFPIAFSLDPINLYFSNIIPNIPRRIIASISYFSLALVGANVCACYMIVILMTCSILEKGAKGNLQRSQGLPVGDQKGWFEKTVVEKPVKLAFSILDKILNKNRIISEDDSKLSSIIRISKVSFQECYWIHNQMRILVTVSNICVDVFVPTMTGVGILLCVTTNYICLQFYNRKDVQIFVMGGAGISLIIHGLILFICKHASAPALYCNDTMVFWKGNVKSGLRRRQARAMRLFGYTIGPYFLAKRSTALDIMHTILDYTISVIIV